MPFWIRTLQRSRKIYSKEMTKRTTFSQTTRSLERLLTITNVSWNELTQRPIQRCYQSGSGQEKARLPHFLERQKWPTSVSETLMMTQKERNKVRQMTNEWLWTKWWLAKNPKKQLSLKLNTAIERTKMTKTSASLSPNRNKHRTLFSTKTIEKITHLPAVK